ncbi:unnamed protein product [Parnassius apollo]|uniref:(apollo) hypothetical protein n=1 Tax=Parnassius apollo TaxID=110799 RepID=A0A8S3X3V2_PARAO|nr:unnamed protein product [Parnassius apollo]
MYTDNWYTSVDLADKLLDSETHLVGTLRKNRKRLPKEVTETKLKPGEYISRENQRGITVMKWRDKREVLLLSTKHSNILKESVSKRGLVTKKPKIILSYNQAKSAVDLSDQMSAYSTPLRKTVKWYRKLACELLLNTSIVNALVLYKQTTKRNISIVKFRQAIIKYLMTTPQEIDTPRPASGSSNYQKEMPQPKKSKNTSQQDLIDIALHYFKKPDDSESDIIAKGWALKLKRLSAGQRRYAEKIKNDILFEAEMGSLSRNGVQILSASSPTYTYSYQSPASHQSSSPVPSPNALHLTTTYQSPAPHQSPSPVPSPNVHHSTLTYQSPSPSGHHSTLTYQSPAPHQSPSPVPSPNAFYSTTTYQSPAPHQSPSPVPSPNALHSTTTQQSPAPHQSPSPVPSPNALHSTTTYQSSAPHQVLPNHS